MSLRFFVALCVCAIFAASSVNARQISVVDEPADVERVLQAVAEEKYDEIDFELEERNPLLKVAIKILKAAFKWVAASCLTEAAIHCKQHWANPPALVKCGGSFFAANKGRCALG